MSELHDTIRAHYLSNIKTLPAHKQFHLCTRLAAWEGDAMALGVLSDLRPLYVPDAKDTTAALVSSLKSLMAGPFSPDIPARRLRQPFFKAFPGLRGINLALFRVRHLDSVYGVDTRPVFTSLVSLDELRDMKKRLLAQPGAVRMLSTYATNFIFLLKRVFSEDNVALEYLYETGNEYDLRDQTHVLLLNYLFTHCIIGDSDFYTRPISKKSLPVYLRMLSRLEHVITDRFDDISLDNKLEFLVCARICDYPTKLADRIWAECAVSLNPDGNYLIDTHNKNARTGKKSFAASEHRNVLFVMSHSPYQPHGTLV